MFSLRPQTKNSSGTFSKNFVQQSTSNNPAKKSAGDQCTDVNLSASTSATSGTTEQLQWKAGEGPSVELRLLVPGKNAGSIIGRKGSNLKQLRRAFGVYMSLTDPNTPDRILSIMGDLGAVCAALLKAIPSIEFLTDKSQDCNIRMLVREGYVGFIIGKAGANIKELRLKTGAKLFIFPECCPRSTERVVQMMGKPVNIANTVGTILELIDPVDCPGPIHLYDPCNFDDSAASEYGGYTMAEFRGLPTQMPPPGAFAGPAAFFEDTEAYFQPYHPGHFSHFPAPPGYAPRLQHPSNMCGPVNLGQHDQPPNMQSGLQSIQLSIPKHLVSTVLGHRCMALKDLRSESKAQIHALVPPAGATERLLTIEGTVEQIQKAQYLIQKRYIDAMCPGASSVDEIDPNAAPPARPRRQRQRPGAPWFNDEIKKEKRLRRKLERVWRAKKTEESHQAYRQQTQKLNHMIRSVKEQYYATHGGGPEKKANTSEEADEMQDDDVESEDSCHDEIIVEEEESTDEESSTAAAANT